ncbi:hypothetical protein VYU27_005615 [Nannochloropsis oceanica]
MTGSCPYCALVELADAYVRRRMLPQQHELQPGQKCNFRQPDTLTLYHHLARLLAQGYHRASFSQLNPATHFPSLTFVSSTPPLLAGWRSQLHQSLHRALVLPRSSSRGEDGGDNDREDEEIMGSFWNALAPPQHRHRPQFKQRQHNARGGGDHRSIRDGDDALSQWSCKAAVASGLCNEVCRALLALQQSQQSQVVAQRVLGLILMHVAAGRGDARAGRHGKAEGGEGEKEKKRNGLEVEALMIGKGSRRVPSSTLLSFSTPLLVALRTSLTLGPALSPAQLDITIRPCYFVSAASNRCRPPPPVLSPAAAARLVAVARELPQQLSVPFLVALLRALRHEEENLKEKGEGGSIKSEVLEGEETEREGRGERARNGSQGAELAETGSNFNVAEQLQARPHFTRTVATPHRPLSLPSPPPPAAGATVAVAYFPLDQVLQLFLGCLHDIFLRSPTHVQDALASALQPTAATLSPGFPSARPRSKIDPVLALPRAVALHLLSFLNPKRLAKVEAVSPAWYDFLSSPLSDTLLWRPLLPLLQAPFTADSHEETEGARSFRWGRGQGHRLWRELYQRRNKVWRRLRKSMWGQNVPSICRERYQAADADVYAPPLLCGAAFLDFEMEERLVEWDAGGSNMALSSPRYSPGQRLFRVLFTDLMKVDSPSEVNLRGKEGGEAGQESVFGASPTLCQYCGGLRELLSWCPSGKMSVAKEWRGEPQSDNDKEDEETAGEGEGGEKRRSKKRRQIDIMEEDAQAEKKNGGVGQEERAVHACMLLGRYEKFERCRSKLSSSSRTSSRSKAAHGTIEIERVVPLNRWKYVFGTRLQCETSLLSSFKEAVRAWRAMREREEAAIWQDKKVSKRVAVLSAAVHEHSLRRVCRVLGCLAIVTPDNIVEHTAWHRAMARAGGKEELGGRKEFSDAALPSYPANPCPHACLLLSCIHATSRIIFITLKRSNRARHRQQQQQQRQQQHQQTRKCRNPQLATSHIIFITLKRSSRARHRQRQEQQRQQQHQQTGKRSDPQPVLHYRHVGR